MYAIEFNSTIDDGNFIKIPLEYKNVLNKINKNVKVIILSDELDINKKKPMFTSLSLILEMGSDFTFMARQKRIVIDNEDHYIDLLFYHRKLQRIILIELKLGKFKAKHRGVVVSFG